MKQSGVFYLLASDPRSYSFFFDLHLISGSKIGETGPWLKKQIFNQNLKNPYMVHGCRASVQTNIRSREHRGKTSTHAPD